MLKAFGKQEDVSVRVTTFETLDEAFTKLSTGGWSSTSIFSSPDHLSQLVGRRLVQPLNFDLIPNLVKNAWPELHSPFYDVGPRYTVPYTVYTTGIGWRNDLVATSTPRSSTLGRDLEGRAAQGQGGHPRRLARGARHGADAPRRDQPQHRGARAAGAGRQGPAGAQLARPRQGGRSPSYESLPAGRMALHQSWSGDMIGAVISYLPKGTPASVLSYWYQKQRRAGLQRHASASARTATKPVIAHRFLNYLLDNKVAYTNFVGYVGYQPPLNAINAQQLFETGVAARRRCADAVVTREDYANGNAYLTLSSDGPAAVGQRAGRRSATDDGRRAMDRSSRRPGCSGWRCSSWSRSTRSWRSGWATSPTLYQPVPHWNPFAWNVGYVWQALQDVLPGGRTWDVFVRTLLYVVVAVVLSLAIGYPVAYYAARHAGRWQGAAAGPAGAAVLDLVPDADVRLDEPARHGRVRARALQRAVDRLAVRQARPARRQRLARRPADHGDHGAGLRLRAVPDPAALRVARPHRPAADRGGARPRGAARAGVPARRAAACRGRGRWAAWC